MKNIVFYKGEKVLCINDIFFKAQLKKGQIYTVAENSALRYVAIEENPGWLHNVNRFVLYHPDVITPDE